MKTKAAQIKKIIQRNSIVAIIAILILFGVLGVLSLGNSKIQISSMVISAKPVSSEISADGIVASQNQATLSFPTGGKLIFLPFKVGDTVSEGATIAQLDTYALQRQLSAALNNYRSTRDTFDQTKDNSQNGVLQGQQRYSIEVTNKAAIGGQGEIDIINDMIKRLVDQNQANLDNSVINVELANYAMQLATLTSPINGVITHEDVTVPNINVTPATTFKIADPNAIVFRANVTEDSIDFISEGSPASIQINGLPGRKFAGTVSKIYPTKVQLSSGQKVYEVDVQSQDLSASAMLDQTGTIQIRSNTAKSVRLVPAWTVLSRQYLWVIENGKPSLRTVQTGKIHGNNIEILSGLKSGDKVIVDPKAQVEKDYPIL